MRRARGGAAAGRGVAMAIAMGKELAAFVSGTKAEDLDYPVTLLQPIPFHALRQPAVSAPTAWYKARERLGL